MAEQNSDCMLKIVTMVNFIVCIFYHNNFKKKLRKDTALRLFSPQTSHIVKSQEAAGTRHKG